MLHRPLLALAMAGAFCSFIPEVPAQTTPGQLPAEPKEVRSWLMRIHEAASHQNFQGTFIVSAGGSVSSARIAHYCEGSNQFERIDSLDGQTRHVFRHNDVVHTVYEDVGARSGIEPAFQSDKIAPGDRFIFAPRAAGTIKFICTLHPATMKGKIVVGGSDA